MKVTKVEARTFWQQSSKMEHVSHQSFNSVPWQNPVVCKFDFCSTVDYTDKWGWWWLSPKERSDRTAGSNTISYHFYQQSYNNPMSFFSDENKCKQSPCHRHANCNSSCTCKSSYQGNGKIRRREFITFPCSLKCTWHSTKLEISQCLIDID